MAKRNKAKFASKSRKSALRVEALEQRQLLAIVSGSGSSPDSYQNITAPNGNVYDQVLMTGSSVTVNADASQVTRVSYKDLSGDIVQAEFSGTGTLTVSLANFVAPTLATDYNQPGVSYVGGNATFIIQGSDATTNFNVFSVGPGNAFNPTVLFEGGKDGGNNVADIQAVQIVSNPANPGGFSNFGGIFAGNAIFSAASGTVGIAAANVNVQGPVIVGDVDATNAGVPTLNFGANSQFSSLTVAGGDLVQTNGSQINGGTTQGLTALNFTAGANSLISTGSNITAKINNNGDLFTAAGEPTSTTLDNAATFDLTGKSQTDINTFFSGRTFTDPIAVTGNLGAGFNITAVEFRGKLTITGDAAGTLTTTSTQSNKGFTGGLEVTGALSNTVTTKGMGSLTVGGVLSGAVLVATVPANNGEGGVLGNVSLGSVAEGRIEAGSIGNITVSGNVTGDGANSGYVFRTTGNTTTNIGNIGTLLVAGDVNLDLATNRLILVDGTGVFGNVTLSGGGTLGGTGTNVALNLGIIQVDSFGAGQTTVGSITITESANVNWGGAVVGATSTIASGKMGDITLTGGSATSGQSLTLSGRIGGNDVGTDLVEVGNITVSGFNTHTLDDTGSGVLIAGAKAGNISITATGGNSTQANSLLVTDFVSLDNGSTSTGETLGNVTFDIGQGSSNTNNAVTINAFNTFAEYDKGATIGAVTLKGRSVTLSADVQAATIGAVVLQANSNTFSTNVGIKSVGTVASLTVTGPLSLGATGTDLAGVTGDTNADATGITPFTLTDVNANIQVKDIGAINVSGNFSVGGGNGAAIAASGTVTSLTIGGTAGFNSTNTSNIQVKAIGDIAIAGTTTFTNSTNPSIRANDNSSTLDTIGNITLARVVGAAAGTEITASSIGNITVTAALVDGGTAVTSFDVLVGPNGDVTSVANANTAATNGAIRLANSEQVVLDGSNLSSYKIGNVSFTSTLAFAYTGTSMFGGDNSIASLGGMGTVGISGGSAGTQQTKLFVAATDAAWFSAGDVDGYGNMTATLAGSHSLGTTTAGNVPDFTAGTTSIGNITINALQTAIGANRSEVDNIAGTKAAAGGTIEGLGILAGVRARNAAGTAAGAGGDIISLNTVGTSVVNMIGIDADLRGTIGSVQITSINAFGFRDPVAGTVNAGTGAISTLIGTNNDFVGGIVASYTAGAIQGGASIASNPGDGIKVVIIGDLDSTTADDEVESAQAASQIVVIVL